MNKNEQYRVTITDLNAQGQGVARIDGQVVFLPGALPGEEVEARIIKVTSRYAVGRVMQRFSDSPVRVKPACPHFPRCGGCGWQHMDYAEQLRQKGENVIQCFRKITMDVPFEGVIGTEPFCYRNKGQFPVTQGRDGIRIGMFAARSHDLVEVESCLIQEEPIQQVLSCVKAWVKDYPILGYDEKTARGLLRHICARHVSGQTAVVLVVTDFRVPGLEDLTARLRDAVPSLSSLFLNLNRKRDNRIYGEELKLIWGKETMTADLNGVKLDISPLSFFQVNTKGMITLYDTVAEFAQITPDSVVYDAYCGAGSIGLYAAPQAKALYGVEEVEPAVKNAIHNAKINRMTHAHYVCGKAEEVFPQWIEEGIRPDVLIVDPPFKGCHEDFLQAAVQAQPDRIVYVSCNPATLARDAAILQDLGYTIRRMRCVDMFPQGEHVETVALLSRE